MKTAFRDTARAGFTLIELLGVIVIIAILASSLLMGYGHFMERARQKNAADVCAQIAAAWTRYHDDLGFWPDAIRSSSVQAMDTKMCEILGEAKLLDVLYLDTSSGADNASGLERNKKDEPELAFGLLDPVGLRFFDEGRSDSDIRDHLYQFVLDEDGDGVISLPSEVGGGEIRAAAAVWCWSEDEDDRRDGIVYAKSWQ